MITLVDVVVFLPIAFIGGPSACSWANSPSSLRFDAHVAFVSFTVTPSLAGIWALKSPWKPWKPIRAFDHGFEWLRNQFTNACCPPR